MKIKVLTVLLILTLLVFSPHLSAVYYQSAQQTMQSEMRTYEQLIQNTPMLGKGILIVLITLLSLFFTLILEYVFFSGYQVFITIIYEFLLETGLLCVDWLFIVILVLLYPVLIPFFSIILIPTFVSSYIIGKLIGEGHEKFLRIYHLLHMIFILVIEKIILQSTNQRGALHVS